MARLRITAKGQVTLNQELLKHLGVNTGEQIEVEKLPAGQILIRAAASQHSMEDFIGCLAQESAPKLTIEEISEIAARGRTKSK